MSSISYLDKTGLALVWEKIKSIIPKKVSDLTNDSGFISSASVSGLSDTTISSLTDGQVLKYDSSSSKWVNAASSGATYTLSISDNDITLTGSDSSTSSISLPVYDGSITDTWEGGSY